MCYYTETWHIIGFKPTNSQQEFFYSLLPYFWGLIFPQKKLFLFHEGERKGCGNVVLDLFTDFLGVMLSEV